MSAWYLALTLPWLLWCSFSSLSKIPLLARLNYSYHKSACETWKAEVSLWYLQLVYLTPWFSFSPSYGVFREKYATEAVILAFLRPHPKDSTVTERSKTYNLFHINKIDYLIQLKESLLEQVNFYLLVDELDFCKLRLKMEKLLCGAFCFINNH